MKRTADFSARLTDMIINSNILILGGEYGRRVPGGGHPGGRFHRGRVRQGDVQGVHRGRDEALPRPVQGRGICFCYFHLPPKKTDGKGGGAKSLSLQLF